MSKPAPTVNLGATIKQLREGNGFTQEQLAEYLGIGRVTLTHYETGTRTPPLSLLEKLATLYGLELADLLDPDATTLALNSAFAFRSAGDLQPSHLEQIAGFRRVVANYLKMKRLDAQQ